MGQPSAAGIYARISHDSQGTALGVTRQRADCEALVARKGWDVAEIYIENDTSAFSRKPRPEYIRMLDDVKNGRVNAVVAWHPDRLHRSPRELEDFIDIIEGTGAKVATCTAGDYDLATPDGRLMARIVGNVARKESEDKSRRLRRKHEELAAAGKVSGGGNRPFGFERDRSTVNPVEANLIQDAARRVLRGESLYAIVNEWTEAGVPTATGARWSTTSLKSTLTRPRVAGLREHHGEVVGKATWDAILDEGTWRQVRAVLINPGRRRSPVARSYLLTGIIRCGLCGARLVAAPRMGAGAGLTVRAYGCHKPQGGCGKISGLAAPIEEFVTEAVLVALDGPALREWKLVEPGQDVAEQIAADEAKLSELADLWADGTITRAEWLRSRARIETRLAESRRQVQRRPANVFGDIDDLRSRWDGLSLDRRRAIISAVLDRVTLGPAVRGNRFDPTRVDVTWRA
jgi:Site-specific recombinases, DNA invertase Pin homologs